MNLVKPYIPVLTIRSGSPVPGLADAGRDYTIALQVGREDAGIDPVLVQQLINGDRPFVLLLDAGMDYTAPAILDTIRLCLFGKRYVQVAGSPVVAFTAEGKADAGNLEKLFSTLQLQGWPSIKQWRILRRPFAEQLTLQKEDPLWLDNISFDEQLLKERFFANLNHIGQYLFFKADSLAAAQALEEAFFALCNRELSGNPLLQAYLQVKRSFDELREQHSVLQERHTSALKIIEVIRYKYKDDYNELFNWYHNEYEVLPLWYKRFGHIVKVITGKRTLQSLFKDNVKKYKD